MSVAALKVTTEARPSSRLAVTVTVPGERCKTSYEDAITSLSRSINLPGFRKGCLLYTSPSPRDRQKSRMPSSA